MLVCPQSTGPCMCADLLPPGRQSPRGSSVCTPTGPETCSQGLSKVPSWGMSPGRRLIQRQPRPTDWTPLEHRPGRRPRIPQDGFGCHSITVNTVEMNAPSLSVLSEGPDRRQPRNRPSCPCNGAHVSPALFPFPDRETETKCALNCYKITLGARRSGNNFRNSTENCVSHGKSPQPMGKGGAS